MSTCSIIYFYIIYAPAKSRLASPSPLDLFRQTYWKMSGSVHHLDGDAQEICRPLYVPSRYSLSVKGTIVIVYGALYKITFKTISSWIIIVFWANWECGNAPLALPVALPTVRRRRRHVTSLDQRSDAAGWDHDHFNVQHMAKRCVGCMCYLI